VSPLDESVLPVEAVVLPVDEITVELHVPLNRAAALKSTSKLPAQMYAAVQIHVLSVIPGVPLQVVSLSK
jgi:hypothetical protein